MGRNRSTASYKVNAVLQKLISKHFLSQVFQKLAIPVSVKISDFKLYWDKRTTTEKQNDLCFFSKDMIEVINKTNSRLLLAEYISKSRQLSINPSPQKVHKDEEYKLLNALELLWSVDQTQK